MVNEGALIDRRCGENLKLFSPKHEKDGALHCAKAVLKEVKRGELGTRGGEEGRGRRRRVGDNDLSGCLVREVASLKRTGQ